MNKFLLILLMSSLTIACSSTNKTTATKDAPKTASANAGTASPEAHAIVDNATTPSSSTTTATVNKDQFITLQRTACYGKCPVYTITILNSGKVIYFGKRFVKNEGYFTAQITSAEIDKLKAKIKEIDYFGLNDKYDSRVTDIPSCVTSVSIDGKTKTVTNRHRAPETLRAFEKLVDEIVLSKKFTPSDKKGSDQ